MPGYDRAQLRAEVKIEPSTSAKTTPQVQIEAGMRAAGATGLAHEAGPDATALAGGREEVLDAMLKVIEASLDAGARVIEVRVEAQEEADKLGQPGGRRAGRMQKMSVDRVNDLSKEEFVQRFGALFEHSPWVAEGTWRERPFESASELGGALTRAMYEAPTQRRLDLIRAHPDLAGKAAMEGALTPESKGEQASAGLDRLAPREYEAFTQLNKAYREKFGFPLVIAVKGHTKETIFASARTRLERGRAEEIEAALAEISRIAGLRLGDLVELEGDGW